MFAAARLLEHNCRYVTRILQLARTAVDGVTPDIRLGPQPWPARAVKFRSSGGFYTDDNPLALLGK